MPRRNIVITESDLRQLTALLSSAFAECIELQQHLAGLHKELLRVRIVSPEEVPDDVVTIDSVVCIRDLDDGVMETYKLVYPDSADIERNRLSVLDPIGTAILGCRVGDVVPMGHRRVRIVDVAFQPERDLVPTS